MGTTDSVVTVASVTCFPFDDSDKQANEAASSEGKSKTGEREKQQQKKREKGKSKGGSEAKSATSKYAERNEKRSETPSSDGEETIAQEHDFQKLAHVQSIQHHQRAYEIKAGAPQAFKEAA